MREPLDPYAIFLALQYHIECEEYDNAVCRNPLTGEPVYRNGVSVPCTPNQMKMIQRHALSVKKEFESKIQDLGQLGRAISFVGRQNWDLARMKHELELYQSK